MTDRTAPTLAGLLRRARSLGVDRLDAQLLAAHAFGCDRAWVLAHDDAPLAASQVEALLSLMRRRAAGEPLAYLTGTREFFGLRLKVTPDVLVPRPDTETLVEWALELLEGPLADRTAPRIVDLGTGSGAIALAIKRACPRAEVHATDRSDRVLAVAQANARRLGLAIHCHRGPWWSAVPGIRFDLAVSNPPYVAPDDPHLWDLRHEPTVALVPEADLGDGLADIERIAADAATHLTPCGWLLLEHGAEQGAAVRKCLQSRGFSAPSTRVDLGGRERVTAATYAP